MTPKYSFIQPHSLDAEHGILGIILWDNSAWADVEGRLRPEHFFEPFHGRLWEEISNHLANGRSVHAGIIGAKFATDKAFADLGGMKYLALLIDKAPPSTMASDFVAVLYEMDVRRRVIRSAEMMISDARNLAQGTADSLLATTEARAMAVARGAGVVSSWETGAALSNAVDDVIAGRGGAVYIPTGIAEFDDQVGGLQDARMNVLAARARMGKSALASIIAVNMARAGRGVAMFSLEMDARELGLRCACAAAYRPDDPDNPVYFEAIKGNISRARAERLSAGGRELRDLPIFFDQREGLRPAQIMPAAQRVVRQWERDGVTPGCIIVDHVMIVDPDDPTGNKVADTSAVSRFFMGMPRRLGVGMLALAQVGRAVDARTVIDKDPILSDIGWSGAWEQDAAQVTFLVRPSVYLQTEPEKATDLERADWRHKKDYWSARAKLINRKNRLGPSDLKIEIGLSVAHNAAWEVPQPCE